MSCLFTQADGLKVYCCQSRIVWRQAADELDERHTVAEEPFAEELLSRDRSRRRPEDGKRCQDARQNVLDDRW